jgi:hypothetical protein
MAKPALRQNPGLIARAAAWPFREVVLGFRDARSPEMREIRERAAVSTIERLGKARYVVRQALATAGVIAAIDVMWVVGEWITPGSFDILGSHPHLESFVFLGAIATVGAAFLASREVKRLREKYPPEEPR